MTRLLPSTKFPKPHDVAAQARLFAEIAADCSRGILPGDYSEAGIADLAAKTEQIFRTMRAEAEADRRAQSPAVAERKRQSPRLRISQMIQQAEKAGKPLASITTPDGTKLDFEREQAGQGELDQWIAKHARAPERH